MATYILRIFSPCAIPVFQELSHSLRHIFRRLMNLVGYQLATAVTNAGDVSPQTRKRAYGVGIRADWWKRACEEIPQPE